MIRPCKTIISFEESFQNARSGHAKPTISFEESFQNGRSGNTKQQFPLRSPSKMVDQALQNDHFLRGILPECAIWQRKPTISFKESCQNARSSLKHGHFLGGVHLKSSIRPCETTASFDTSFENTPIRLTKRPNYSIRPWKTLRSGLQNNRILRHILRKHLDHAYKTTKFHSWIVPGTPRSN